MLLAKSKREITLEVSVLFVVRLIILSFITEIHL